MPGETYDVVIIGSGFGGSVTALRLAERGYRVLVLERGRRFGEADFAKSNWQLSRYLWAPVLRCFGILQISPFRDVVVLHGAGVGGGSLGYANVLMEPTPELFQARGWRELANWPEELRPHYDTARRMLGVAPNPRITPADEHLREIAKQMGVGSTFAPTTVGTFFGDPGREGDEYPDPYFGGDGPARRSCTHCGHCMVGCPVGAKNTLVKNYLYLAERRGVQVRAECEVRDIRPVAGAHGARYEVSYRSSTELVSGEDVVRARAVIVAAGALGTLRLLFRCRDVTRSLPDISPTLGNDVRTNAETLLGSMSRDRTVDYSKGIAITSTIQPDAITTIEPVRYPAGSSFMRFLAGPIVTSGGFLSRLLRSAFEMFRRPPDFLRTHVLPGWAERTTILLVMRTTEEKLRLVLGRSALTGFRRGLVSAGSEVEKAAPETLDVGVNVARRFSERTGGILAGTINEGLFGVPMTAHILGGCTFGRTRDDGVINLDCEVHGYPGLFVVDGSIVPANPGVNPSLTITAFAEYASTRIPSRIGAASGS